MKNIVLVALMLFGMTLPTNVRAEISGDSLSVLIFLDFHLAGDDGDGCNNSNAIKPYSFSSSSVCGKLYSNGQLELTYDGNDALYVSVKLNDSEVNSTEFISVDSRDSLTFDLDDYGRGVYEVNVTMPDGSVQTATFEY